MRKKVNTHFENSLNGFHSIRAFLERRKRCAEYESWKAPVVYAFKGQKVHGNQRFSAAVNGVAE
jgi:hypothetical protein